MLVNEQYSYDKAAQTSRLTWHYRSEKTGKTLKKSLNLRCFFPEELLALVHYNGFKVLRRYGDFRRRPFSAEAGRLAASPSPALSAKTAINVLFIRRSFLPCTHTTEEGAFLLQVYVEGAVLGFDWPGLQAFGGEGRVGGIGMLALRGFWDRTAQGRAAADVELGVMQRAGKDPAGKSAALQPRFRVAAGALHGVEGPGLIAQDYLAPVQRDGFHPARGYVFFFGGFNEHKYKSEIENRESRADCLLRNHSPAPFALIPDFRFSTFDSGICFSLSGSVTSLCTNKPHQQRFMAS